MSKPRATKPVTDAPPKGAAKPAPQDTSAPRDKAAVLEKARKEGAVAAKEKPARPRPHPDPTRYGDWEKNGRCIDF